MKPFLKLFAGSALGAIGLIISTASGALAETPSKTKKSFSVALVLDYSGTREAAIEVVKGAEIAASTLAQEEIFINFEKYDSRGGALDARNAMEKAIKGEHDFIIAEVDSSKALVAGELAEKAGRIMLTPYATSPKVTEGKKYVFRACFDDEFQGLQLANFALKNLSSKKAIIVSDAGELYSQGLASTFEKAYTENGGQVILHEKVLSQTVKIDELVKGVLLKEPDVLFLPVYESFAAKFIEAAASFSSKKISFLGGDGWGTSSSFPLRDLIFKKERVMDAYWVTHFSDTLQSKEISRVRKQYAEEFGKGFGGSVAIGYDAMMIAGQALKSAGVGANQDAILKAMREIQAFNGLTGKISFKKGNSPEKSIFLNKVGPGRPIDVLELKP